MNTNQLKRFAQEARIKLLKQVEAKLAFVLTSDSPELREKANEVKQLNDELSKTTKAHLIEKVAYTWFNRLMALRYMDANDYQPLGIRIITPKDGYTLPELLDAAKQGNIPDELPVKTQHIYDLLDEKVKSTNPQNEAYKELLIGACNHLNKVFPFLFERINDYTELLMPDDLISEFSIVHDVREGMSTDDCQEVEIIGWLYQFYISEKKDEVFASKNRVKKEDIPAATQLFTPRWIVEYMVQNTVGKLWLQNHPNSKLREHMPYFIESESLNSENYLKINSVEVITLLDQACGSGHILVYGFELLAKIYEEEGYNPNEIPQLIIEKNLFGFEIDERAAQLASLTLMMKARSYQRRVFRKELKPNILCFKDLNLTTDEIKETFTKVGINLSDELLHDLLNMQQATNLGSLIIPHSELTELERTLTAIGKNNSPDMYLTPKLKSLKKTVNQLILLSKKHHCVVDNPPYMGGGAMNKELADFVKINYPESKADLMACFMEAGLKTLKPKGFLGMINQHSWMYNPTYIKLRKTIINEWVIDTLIHLGPHTFPEIGGEVVQNAAFTIINVGDKQKSFFKRLIDFKDSESKKENFNSNNIDFLVDVKDFKKIEEFPFAYWIKKSVLSLITSNKSLKHFGDPRPGLQTSNNDRFLREWYEVNNRKIGFKQSKEEAINSDFKWFPHNKGGRNPKKWYGNNTLVINFYNDAEELKHWLENNPNDPSTKHWSRNMRNYSYYFKEGITWSAMSSNNITSRLNGKGFLFDTSGPTLFVNSNLLYFCGLLNSNVFSYFVNFFSQTLSKSTGDFSRVPIILQKKDLTEQKVNICFKIAKESWLCSERSNEYEKNNILIQNGFDLEESYDLYQQYWQTKFFQLHKNEEELNRQFIEIYGLQEELTPDVPLEDITILKDELEQRELKKLSDSYKSGWVLNDNKWELNTNNLYENISLPFNAKEVFAQFMSYAVGCMFGRYSLDKEGLILANQGETLEDYMKIVNGGIVDSGSKDGEITKNQDYDKGLQGTKDLAAEHGVGNGCISTNETNAEGRNLQSNRSNKESSSKHSKQYSRRTSQGNKGVSSLPEDSSRVSFGIGDAIDDYNKSENVEKGTNRTFAISDNQSKKTSLQAISETSINQSPTTNHQPTFYPDDDNIIPILDEEWFEDDIVGRFNEFLKVSFGEDNFSKNLAFVEEQLGKDIRRYFMRDFYTDHIKRYKRRPIYWLFSSPKGAFNVLIYMHRYTQDTVSNILNKYLREFSGKLKTRKETLQHIIVHGDASDKTKAIKENDSIDKMLLDLHEYERDILYPIATERIPIDLDDGVLVNYNKFGNALKAVPGLNDKKTKDKVRKFDWIDSSTII